VVLALEQLGWRDWVTAEDLAQQTGMSESAVRRVLRGLDAAGRLSVGSVAGRGRRATVSGYQLRRPHARTGTVAS
jgi:predicted ArsR family transcriptional regulator